MSGSNNQKADDPWAAAAKQQESDENYARMSNKMENLKTDDQSSPSTQQSTPSSSQSNDNNNKNGNKQQPQQSSSTSGGGGAFGATSKVFGAFKLPPHIQPGSTHAFGSPTPTKQDGGSSSSAFGGTTSPATAQESTTGHSAFGGSSGNRPSSTSSGGAAASFGGGATFGSPAFGGFTSGTGDGGGGGGNRGKSSFARMDRKASQEDESGFGGGGGGSPSSNNGWGRTPSPVDKAGGGWTPSYYQHDDRGADIRQTNDYNPVPSQTTSGSRNSSSNNNINHNGNQQQQQQALPTPTSHDTNQQSVRISGGGDYAAASSNNVNVKSRLSNVSADYSGNTDNWDEQVDEDAKAEASVLNKLLHNQLVKIKDKQIDFKNLPSSSPLYSFKSFHELHLNESLVKGVTAMGFHAPSKIQEVALPVLIGEPPTNMVAQSQSGTGKTAAFVLTMLNRVNADDKYPQCLCLAPTYELAIQIGKVCEKMGKYMDDIEIMYAVRGNRISRGQPLKSQIIIGTPGTALDWVVKYHAFEPSRLRVFVLDEADVMISEQGHKEQSIRIKRLLSEECQLLLFSATYDDDVMAFAETMVDMTKEPPVIITVRREEQTLDNILQYKIAVNNREEKFQAIHNIYGCLTIGQSIIFCHTKASANWLSGKMRDKGHEVGILTGELQIEDRAAIIQRFKEGYEKVLITTNVCSRGIDVAQVNLVINYDVPMRVEPDPNREGRFRPIGADYETYLHRIGRTGRFGKSGIAVNFVDSEQTRQIIEDIQNHFGKEIKALDATDLDALEEIEEHRR